MKVTSAAFTLLLFVLVTPLYGQDASRTDFEDFCDAFQGRWVGDVVWIDDWPGFGKKGDKVKCYTEFNVVEDGNAITGKFYGGSGSASFLITYNAATKRIEERAVSSGGTVFNTTWVKKDDQWLGTQTGSNPDGAELKANLVITVSDNGNKHSVTGSTTIGGKPADDLQDVWVRVSEQ